MQHTSSNERAEQEASQSAEQQMKAIEETGRDKGDAVVQELLRIATDVQPEVPNRIVAPT